MTIPIDIRIIDIPSGFKTTENFKVDAAFSIESTMDYYRDPAFSKCQNKQKFECFDLSILNLKVHAQEVEIVESSKKDYIELLKSNNLYQIGADRSKKTLLDL